MISRQWRHETCFIVAGGPSVAEQPLKLLGNRKVIAVNSSYLRVPFAQYLFFADSRWWEEEIKERAAKLDAVFALGMRFVTSAAEMRDPRVMRFNRVNPPPLAADPGTVAVKRTSLTGAINIAVHLGVNRIVLVGADCKPTDDGRTHHHAPHPWQQREECYRQWIEELEGIVPSLAIRNVEVINASPGSALMCWPIMTLADAVALQ